MSKNCEIGYKKLTNSATETYKLFTWSEPVSKPIEVAGIAIRDNINKIIYINKNGEKVETEISEFFESEVRGGNNSRNLTPKQVSIESLRKIIDSWFVLFKKECDKRDEDDEGGGGGEPQNPGTGDRGTDVGPNTPPGGPAINEPNRNGDPADPGRPRMNPVPMDKNPPAPRNQNDNDPCEKCNACYSKYRDAIYNVVGHIRKVLDNKTIGVTGTAPLAPEPGCLKAVLTAKGVTSGSEMRKEEKLIDPLSPQPNNKENLSQYDEVTTNKNKKETRKVLERFKQNLGIGLEKTPQGTPKMPVQATRIEIGYEGQSKQSLEYCSYIMKYVSDKFENTDHDPPRYYNKNDSTVPGRKPEEHEALKRLSDVFGNVNNYCCYKLMEQAISKMFEDTSDLGPFGNIATLHGKGNNYKNLGSKNVLQLPYGLGCCTDLSCPKLKCGKPSANSKAMDDLIEKLSEISNPSDPSCVDKLKNSIGNILYNDQDGLHNRIIKHMILKSAIYPGKLTQETKKVNFYNEFKHYQNNCAANIIRATSETSDTGLTEPGGYDKTKQNPPDKGLNSPERPTGNEDRHVADKEAEFLSDCLFAQTYGELKEGFGEVQQGGTGAYCEYPILIPIDLTLEKFRVDGQDLFMYYKNLVKTLEDRVKEIVDDRLKDIVGPSQPLDKDIEECKKLKELLAKYVKDRERLQVEINKNTAELGRLAKVLSDLETKRSSTPEDFPDLPPNPPRANAECDRLRREYEITLVTMRTISRSIEALNGLIEEVEREILSKEAQLSIVESVISLMQSLVANGQGGELANPGRIAQISTAATQIGTPTGTTAGTTNSRLLTFSLTLKSTYQTKIAEIKGDLSAKQTQKTDKTTLLQTEKEKSAALARSIKELCGRAYQDWEPLTPEEAATKKSREDLIGDAIDTIKSNMDDINKKNTDLKLQETESTNMSEEFSKRIILLCPDKTGANVTVRSCFLDCILRGLTGVSSELLSVDLTPFIKGKCPEKEKYDGGDVAPGHEDSWTIFNQKLSAEALTEKIKKIITECISPPPPDPNADPATQPPDPCEEFLKKKTKLEGRVKELEKIADKEIWKIGYMRADVVPIGGIPTSSGGTVHRTDLGKQLADSRISTGMNFNINEIRSIVEETLNEDPIVNAAKPFTAEEIELSLQKALAILNKIYRLRMEVVIAKRELDTVKKLHDACENIKNNPNTKTCEDLIEEFKDQILAQLDSDIGSVWDDFYNQAKELLADQDGPLPKLRESIAEQIAEHVKKLCPEPLDTAKGAYLYPGEETQSSEYMSEITEENIRYYCDGITPKLAVTVKLKRFKWWDTAPGSKVNCYWDTITGWLNSTIICDDKPSGERKSIFHDLWEKEIEPKGNEMQKRTKLGPAHIPYFPPLVPADGAQPGDPAAPLRPTTGGPYYFPPPNSYQQHNPQEEGDFEAPCPETPCHIPDFPFDLADRFSLIRRFYYEMISVYQYLDNIQIMVGAVKPVLEALKEGLVHCSAVTNKDKPYIPEKGAGTLLDPAVHKGPHVQQGTINRNADGSLPDMTNAEAAKDVVSKAITEAAINGECPGGCKGGTDVVSGD